MAIKSINFCMFLAITFISANALAPKQNKAPLPSKFLPAVDYLSFDHYHKSCPDLEDIVHNKTEAWVKKDPTLAASIIRLHFHDCAVRGCDASILINTRNSERWAIASKTLRGFQVIDDIKRAVEKRCPKIVSCADILTTAARDATVLVKGPFWEVPFGRKDGLISIAREVDVVPHGRENMTTLINFFQSKGLNLLDLVILSGSHTIGRSTCGPFKHRLVPNFNNTRKPDPSLDAKFSALLKKQCRTDSDYANLDVTSPKTFDVVYYRNLQRKLGLLTTDQLLNSDVRTMSFVGMLATQPDMFFNQFAVSMVKLGNVQVLTRPLEGEIRRDCNYVNV